MGEGGYVDDSVGNEREAGRGGQAVLRSGAWRDRMGRGDWRWG